MTDSEKIEHLQALVKELADELAEWVEHNYQYTKDHPGMKRRYNRDIEPVLQARTLLEKIHENN